MMRYVGVFLIALFGGFLFYISRPAFVDKVATFTPVDWGAIIIVPAGVLIAHFVYRFHKHGELSSRDILWLSIGGVTVLLISILVYWVKTETASAIVLGAYLASLGWIYTNYSNGVMHRKSHTMNVLIQLRNSAEFQKHKNCVLARFPFGRAVTQNDMADLKRERITADSYKDGKCPLLDSAYYITNYYEFISIAVLAGDLDVTMIQNTYRTILLNWFKHIEPIIRDAQMELNGQHNPRIFAAYMKLVEHFQKIKLRSPNTAAS